ncbi:hypothetical protein K435DRAFT_804264 [Dendrothele bispora CBS 962.96]|uniref:Uncharacterized protein n=1 Tax=Dendrothele bispora (strain CBS 962.96) TaxID=1314807 RepID=A0A4S8LFN9_DENBC|nr:hypothetical protein K435DRAFT_804264 [Dendrothele bispora CBS 962.96]
MSHSLQTQHRPLLSKKKLWAQQSQQFTKTLYSKDHLQTSPIAWSFVSNSSVEAFPKNAINFASKNDQPWFLCRSIFELVVLLADGYENLESTLIPYPKPDVGKVHITSGGFEALISEKSGKEHQVTQYEVLVQTSMPPQYSFLPIEARISSDMDMVFIVNDSNSMTEVHLNNVQIALSNVAKTCNKFETSGFDIRENDAPF